MTRRALPFLALVTPFAANAAAPALIPVTGYLTDSNGDPVDGDVSLELTLYTSATDATPLWTETQDGVAVDNGQFTVYLGDGQTLALEAFRDNGSVFLGLAVDAGAEMTPRFEVATAPFAAYAQYCDDAVTVGGLDPATFRTTDTKVAWTDLDAATLPTGLDDGDDDTTYTAGEGLALSAAGEFTADKVIVEGWAKGVAYDTLSELQAVLDTVYAAKLSCTANQVLMANSSGAWTCTDATALPISESAVDAAVANNGFALATDLTALTSRVTAAESGLTANGAVDATQTTNITALTSGLTANTAIDATQTTNIATVTTGLTANGVVDATQTTNITTLQTTAVTLAGNQTLTGNNSFSGTLRVPSGTALPAVAAAGGTFFNTADQQFYISTGTAWIRLSQASTSGLYPASCLALKTAAPATPDGFQWIDPDGAGSVAAYPVYCDMTTNGGGWTLVWTKVSWQFNTFSATPNYACGRSTDQNCASAVPAALTWTRAMWRFADSSNVTVEYDKSANAGFTAYLNGASVQTNGSVPGFTRNMAGTVTGPAAITNLYFYNTAGISEVHSGGTDQWLDLWNGADTSNAYTFTETAQSWGTKCIAGWCSYNSPVWMMVR